MRGHPFPKSTYSTCRRHHRTGLHGFLRPGRLLPGIFLDFVSKSADSAAALDDPASATPSFIIDVEGRYELSFSVYGGQFHSEINTVVVSNNSRP
ncbi:MAG: hypothetical protein ACU836_04615 [Gammaproteobacteria bacterium]